MYIRREIEGMIRKTAESFPCIVIYGPRQVGKSTTVFHLFGDSIPSVTLDDTDDLSLALNNPKLFLDNYPWPVVIDEIQKAPGLLNEIKKRIDQQRLIWMKNDEPRQLMYVLTGSNRFELQEGISESLAGRCGLIEMNSFSQMEKLERPGHLFSPDIKILKESERVESVPYQTREEIFKGIFDGGMPDIYTGNSEREIYFKSYMDTYIEKDVRKLISASSEMLFRNFVSLAALRTGAELHYEELAAGAGIDVKTCKRWLSILQTSGLIYLLHPYLTNLSKRVVKAPKMYFMDTGLCSYLCKWPNSEMLQNGAMGGAFFETFVISEMIKNLQSFGKDPREHLYYYRDIDQKEIDVIFSDVDKIYPIEIKKGISPKNPGKNFKVLEKYQLNQGNALVIDCCDRIRPLTEKVFMYPVFLLGA